jgi:hypothetical protein
MQIIIVRRCLIRYSYYYFVLFVFINSLYTETVGKLSWVSQRSVCTSHISFPMPSPIDCYLFDPMKTVHEDYNYNNNTCTIITYPEPVTS